MWGSVIGGLVGSSLSGGGSGPGARVGKRHPQGTLRHYDDSYQQLFKSLFGALPEPIYEDRGPAIDQHPLIDDVSGGNQRRIVGQEEYTSPYKGTRGLLANLLGNFKGSTEDLEGVLESPIFRSMQAEALKQSPAYEQIQDFRGLANQASQAYGPAAGMIGQTAMQGARQGQNMLSSMGLGRAAGRASLAQQAMQQAAGQQGGLFANIAQQRAMNLSNFANQAFDVNRQIAQMSLGRDMTPRTGGGGGSSLGGALGGAGMGAAAGAAAGPVGMAIGAALGGLGGAVA